MHSPLALTTLPLLGLASLLGAWSPEGEEAPATHTIAPGPFQVTLERDAVLVPSESTELVIRPEEFAGKLEIEEIVPPGSQVKSGQVILRLAADKVDDQLGSARLDLKAAEQRLRDAELNARIVEAEIAADLARREKGAINAENALKAWLEVERQMSADSNQLTDARIRSSIEDAEEEIRQLGQMYKEDELTEETEEIVLRRSQRDLALQKASYDLYKRNRSFDVEYREPLRLESLTLASSDATRELERFRRTMAGRRTAVEIEQERAKIARAQIGRSIDRLERDREQFTYKAPRDGILLHGDARGKNPKKLQRGDIVAPKTELLTVAVPGRLSAYFTIDEKHVFDVRGGMKTVVTPVASESSSTTTRLDPIDAFPSQRGDANAWDATARLANPDARLLPGMKAKVVITIHDLEDVITVPNPALSESDGETVVWVKADDAEAQKRIVRKGVTDGTSTVITSGLSAGEKVLVKAPETQQ